MIIIGTVLAALAVLALALCALADPVLLSRVNGEHAEGASGRHIAARPEPTAPLAVLPAVAQEGLAAA
ncbi:hypothetical protein AB0K60_22020 [Thermopolyspora sp. NPDC052614]|uniref:hypothetical protein n=1 Tax=Thermopolyspora sp. NPDC052614 TaxID=3155682 RepID=UPI003422EFDF